MLLMGLAGVSKYWKSYGLFTPGHFICFFSDWIALVGVLEYPWGEEWSLSWSPCPPQEVTMAEFIGLPILTHLAWNSRFQHQSHALMHTQEMWRQNPFYSPLNPLIFCWWLEPSVLMTEEEFKAHRPNICIQRHSHSILWLLIQ